MGTGSFTDSLCFLGHESEAHPTVPDPHLPYTSRQLDG